MAAVEEIQNQIRALPLEKRRLLADWLSAEVGAASSAGIETNPEVCGGSPTIAKTRIPVWLIEQMRRQGCSAAEILANFPTLKAEDLTRAWSYAAAHPESIEEEIRRNEEA